MRQRWNERIVVRKKVIRARSHEEKRPSDCEWRRPSVREMERDREWAMRRMKEGRKRGCGGAGSRRTRLYTGNPPAACWSTDRSYRVCSTVLPSLPHSLFLRPSSPYSFQQRVRDSLSDTHPSSTFSLYISLSSMYSSVQAREERLPSATCLASRDTRITTVMFC